MAVDLPKLVVFVTGIMVSRHLSADIPSACSSSSKGQAKSPIGTNLDLDMAKQPQHCSSMPSVLQKWVALLTENLGRVINLVSIRRRSAQRGRGAGSGNRHLPARGRKRRHECALPAAVGCAATRSIGRSPSPLLTLAPALERHPTRSKSCEQHQARHQVVNYHSTLHAITGSASACAWCAFHRLHPLVAGEREPKTERLLLKRVPNVIVFSILTA